MSVRGHGYGGAGKGYNNGVPIPGEPARLVGLLTAGPVSKLVTDVTPPGATLLQALGPGAREVVREWVVVVREEWAQG